MGYSPQGHKESDMTEQLHFTSLHFISYMYTHIWASLVAQTVKNLPAMWETWVRSLGQEDPLEKGMVSHPSSLAWRIPRIEEPGRRI